MSAIKKAFVDCYLSHNFGDDLFLETLLSRYPSVQFVCIADERYSWLTEKYQNITIVPPESFHNHSRFGKFAIVNMIKRSKQDTEKKCKLAKSCDVLVVIGGSLFIQPIWKYSLLTGLFSLLDVIHRKRLYSSCSCTCIMGANFGPYESKWYLNAYRSIFRKNVSDICVRDTYTAKLFDNVEIVRMAPDILFATPLPDVKKQKKVFFSIVNLGNRAKFRNLADSSERYDLWVTKLAQHYSDRGYSVVLCSFAESEQDDIAVKRIYENLSSSNISVSTLFYDNDTNLIKREIVSSEIVVGTRFHASILALSAGCKLLPVIYSDKTSNVLNDISFQGPRIDLRNFDENDMSVCESLVSQDYAVMEKIKQSSLNHFEYLDSLV